MNRQKYLAPQSFSGPPFLAVYEADEWRGPSDVAANARAMLASELHDDELDEAIFEAIGGAAELYHHASRDGDAHGADRVLRQHFSNVRRELEQALDAAGEHFGDTPLASLNENETAAFFDSYSPKDVHPTFENLFGGILKAIKKVAGTAVHLAKSGIGALASVALKPLLAKLKALAWPLLEHVLTSVISRLPEALQTPATLLGRRLGLLKEFEDEQTAEATPATCVGAIQREFNTRTADILLAPGEVERDLEVARIASHAGTHWNHSLADLDRARNELSDRLRQLKEGEDAGPAFENFLPALVPVLKLGEKLVGRENIISFLANLLSKMLQRFIGPQYAPALSKAIVDAGLRLFGLEISPDDAAQAARSAVTSTAEETVDRVTMLPDEILNNRELLEGAALEAFEQAAAANFPPVLGQETYLARPDLRESSHARGTWIALPLHHHRRYKKYSRVLRVRVTPEKARVIETFGGSTLGEFLEEQLGHPPGADLEAEVHLYEAMPGTLLPELARMEGSTPGLGSSEEAAWGRLHPLTHHAAGTLLGEPGLGRHMPPESLAGRHAIGPGQRFYHLNVHGMHPAMSASGHKRLRRHSSLKILLNFRTSEISLRVYLAENVAQALAATLRDQGHLGSILSRFRHILEHKLDAALRPTAHGGVRIVHPDVPPQQAGGGALQRLPPAVIGVLRTQLLAWALQALQNFLKTQPQLVRAAVESPADGITILAVFHDPPILSVLRDVLSGKPIPPGPTPAATMPKVDVTIAAGHVHG